MAFNLDRMIAAAYAGLVLGATGCAQNKPALSPNAGSQPAAAAAEAKACCKGRNDCRGKGGCETDTHACAGQNACKGQGGCNHQCPK